MSKGTGQWIGGCGCLVVALPLAALMAFSAIFGSPSPAAQPGGGLLDESKVPAAYVGWVAKAGQLCTAGKPPILTAPVIAAQIEAESGWDPKAVSPAGAQGLSQFMPSTFNSFIPGTDKRFGQDDDGTGNVSPFNAADAIMAQARYDCYLAGEMQRMLTDGTIHGDLLDLTLAGYNAGVDAVQSAGGVPHITETQGYVAKIHSLIGKYTKAGSAPTPGSGGFGDQVVTAAEQWLGTPYSWGGGDENGPSYGSAQGAYTKGFDCSGLVLYAVYQASGRTLVLPRVSEDQVTVGQEITNRTDMRPGDVIGFEKPGSGDFSHIGIYIGNGQMVHAPQTGEVVKIANLDDSYWQGKIWNIRRYG